MNDAEATSVSDDSARILAAIVLVVAVGILLSITLMLMPPLHSFPDVGSVLASLIFGVQFAVIFGSVPAFLTFTITPVKGRPWRALPILLLVSFGVVLICFSSIAYVPHNVPFGIVVAAFFIIPGACCFLVGYFVDEIYMLVEFVGRSLGFARSEK